MSSITKITGREILDSRGNPALEVEIILDSKIKSFASVPSGISVGAFEALELRDGDQQRYHGLGLLKSLDLISGTLTKALLGKEFSSLKAFDQYLIEIDGTINKGRLGANTTLALSLAFAKVLAKKEGLEVYQVIAREYSGEGIFAKPIPMLNLINGGKHSDNGLALQEFMIVPPAEMDFKERMRIAAEFFYELREELKKAGERVSVGDEGGFAPNFSYSSEALDSLMRLIDKRKYQNCKIALDAAASSFYKSGYYAVEGAKLSPLELIDYYKNLLLKYPIISIEDPMAENDLVGWQAITKELSNKILLIGDDLFVTNYYHLEKGLDEGLANAILIKPNQVGTLTETLKTVTLARQNNYEVVVSHRSGETEETVLAQIALGIQAKYLKAGAPCRSERLAKYNELIRLDV